MNLLEILEGFFMLFRKIALLTSEIPFYTPDYQHIFDMFII